MALYNLSYVTQTYIELIKRAFATSADWVTAVGPPPNILPVSPWSLNVEGIGFYLYHVLESKTHANFPVPTADRPPVRFLPMALSLYYQLTANSLFRDENGPYREQWMLGIAMKALHDCAYIDDTTMVDTTPGTPQLILPKEIRGMDNRFRISQQPVAYNDAVHNWTAGQAPMKLSAYYEASTVFLEPDDTKTYTGRTLMYGNYIFVQGAPKITGSQSILSFILPGETAAKQVIVQPAQAPPDNTISFFGYGFDGDNVQLRLLNPRWPDPVIASPNWNIQVNVANSLSVTIRQQAISEKTRAAVDVLPGIYSAQAIVTRTVKLPNGQVRDFKNTSNQSPFTVAPRIDNISPPSATGIITIKGYIFQYPVLGTDILLDAIEVYLGENRIIRNTTATFNPGEFKTTAANLLLIQLPVGTVTGAYVPLRILINGAESSPAWAQT